MDCDSELTTPTVCLRGLAVQELSSNQSNLQTQLSLAKAAETSANRELRESNDELLREKALWARDAADLDRERRDRIRLEVEVQSLQAERTRLLRDSEELDRERRTRQIIERELEEGRDELRRERKEGRDREEELRREITRIGREEKERSEELELERECRKRERTEIEGLKVRRPLSRALRFASSALTAISNSICTAIVEAVGGHYVNSHAVDPAGSSAGTVLGFNAGACFIAILLLVAVVDNRAAASGRAA